MAFDTDKYTRNPFIKGEDLPEGDRVVVTIKTAEEVTFPSGDTVPVLEFLELDQKLTLNKTRIKKCVELLGEDTDEWIGQKIALYQIDVTYQGKTMPGVAVGKAPKKAGARAAVLANDEQFEQPVARKAKPAAAVTFEEEEDIPF